MSNFNNNDNPYAADNFTDNSYGNFNTPVPNVPDYLVLSILETLFCCQPLGIAAIVFSVLASSEKNSRNYAKAISHAKNAKICLLVGVIGGALIILFAVIMAIVGEAAGNM